MPTPKEVRVFVCKNTNAPDELNQNPPSLSPYFTPPKKLHENLYNSCLNYFNGKPRLTNIGIELFCSVKPSQVGKIPWEVTNTHRELAEYPCQIGILKSLFFPITVLGVSSQLMQLTLVSFCTCKALASSTSCWACVDYD